MCYLRNPSSAIQFKSSRETDISKLYCSIGKIYKELNGLKKSIPAIEHTAARGRFRVFYLSVFNAKTVHLKRVKPQGSHDSYFQVTLKLLWDQPILPGTDKEPGLHLTCTYFPVPATEVTFPTR